MPLRTYVINTKRYYPHHFKTLLGERESGSKWGRKFTEEDFHLNWEDRTFEVPEGVKVDGCLYFRLNGKDLEENFPKATVCAVPTMELDSLERIHLGIRAGEHGAELVIPESKLRKTFLKNLASEAWVVVGPEENHMVVFTAHPGPLLKPLPADTLRDIFQRPYAVKIV